MRTRVKICGITRSQDAEFAAKMGADAIGLVFYPKSPRAVTIAQAQQIIVQLPPFITTVALFVDADTQFVQQCIESMPLDVLQFHGNEIPEYCEQFAKPYLKAIRMHDQVDLKAHCVSYQSASGLLVDSYKLDVPGGTGLTFDWSLIEQVDKPVILAGGLTAENVRSAIKQVQPFAVDVSGGVERVKGIKDNEKIRAFMQEVANG